MVSQQEFSVQTRGRGTQEISDQIDAIVTASGARQGLCNLFIQHTSASLIICENADPTVRVDLETFLAKTVIDGDPDFRHTTEGTDDMPAHIRTILTDCSITIPIRNGRCLLGTWQGIYLYEHRQHAYDRKITVTIYAE